MASKSVRARILKGHREIDGEYVAVVLKVESKDSLGRPKSATLFYDEEQIHLEGGEEFLVVFAKRECVEPVTKGEA